MTTGYDTPPLAYPALSCVIGSTGSRQSTPPPHRSHADPWASPAGGTFLLSGSTAPRIVTSRRAPPLRGHSARQLPPSPAMASASPSPPTLSRRSSPVLMRQAICFCCATRLDYPRHASSFTCFICQVTNDLSDSPRAISRDCVSEQAVLDLSDRLARPSDLAERLQQVDLDETARETDAESEQNLVDLLVAAFSSLDTLDKSFLPVASTSAPTSPALDTLTLLYSLVSARPDRIVTLRSLVSKLLNRPGNTLDRLSGNWIITLIESPIFDPAFTPDPGERRILYSQFIGILSNVPSTQHRLVVQHLSSHPVRLTLSISTLTSYISNVLSTSATHYSQSWQVLSGAKVSAVFLAAATKSREVDLSDFYVTAIDALGEDEWIRDFQEWESSHIDQSDDDSDYHTYAQATTERHFNFCQYPFLMSLGTKQRLFEFETQRQITDEAAAAFRTSNRILHEDNLPLLVLNVRRNRLVEDSLHQISGNRENLRKSLRIKFHDEEGIDAGGLRKEWFLLLCRSLFSPTFGMFTSPDPDTNLSWFNPASTGMVEDEDYWLLGAVIGLGCYHADTLDIPLPLVTYKKLLKEPGSGTLADLAQFQPALARGLQQLWDHDEDDVEQVYCRTFVGTYEAWGELVEVELCPGGKDRVVTRDNRKEYVSLVVDFILNGSISTQFEAFSNGFNEVCSGNALSLLRGQELELLVRGSDEMIDVETLKSVTRYQGFYENDPVIQNFWTVFACMSATRQKQLLSFITSSDRIPSTGLHSLHLQITCLGRMDSERLPVSRTCFNELQLWDYTGGTARLEKLITMAMDESEGFGLR
ncbi:putative E3 ubiquitin-protein ligase HUL4 [Sporobolomyces koalae]|uniref:putative E3 ubiquitin-protein ligase HUL4 n=1 Tax=Sporobolomyces koalae TaxID=500713 RepID=UPI0031700E01